MKQLTLFPEAPAAVRPAKNKNDYEAFVDKFKPKLTTDDCYTPAPVYDAVLAWVRKNCDIAGCNILRPFYPGGDFEAVEYGPDDVVVDNPPFSIITPIVRWYTERGIRFFLFAPHLTVFQPGKYCTSIVCEADVRYENGALVNTSFVSNLFGDTLLMSAPDLYQELEAVQEEKARRLPKYIYPAHVLRVTDVAKYTRRGISFVLRKRDGRFVSKLDLQGGAGIFGGGYLISDRAAADRAAADRAAADRAAQVEAIEWTLSDRERKIIEGLG